MENNELFQTIEQLKNTLSDVASARQQVEDVISAYTHTNTEINSYIENFERIEVAISAVIKLLNNNNAAIEQQANFILSEFEKSCTSVVDDIKKELTASAKQFDVATNQNIDNMTKQIEKLHTTINGATKLVSCIEIISTELTKLINFINTIKESLNVYQEIQKGIINSLLNQDNVLNNQQQELQTLSNLIKQSLSILSTNESKIETLCDNVLSSISHSQQFNCNSIDSLKQTLEENIICISKGININRWLIIIGFIVLTIIHFI